jgi:hypothetical protein
MTPTPKRRWFRFSLRTLFVVVTVGCIWLGWQVKVVRDRRAALEYFSEQERDVWLFPGPSKRSIPAWRRWLGDTSIATITTGGMQRPQDLELARTCFPEAVVLQFGSRGLMHNKVDEGQEVQSRAFLAVCMVIGVAIGLGIAAFALRKRLPSSSD